MRRVLKAAAIMLVFAASAAAQERYVRPVDDGKKDPTFVEFRNRLIKAAENRDSKFILSILDPKIRLSFGGQAGIADFKEIWKIDAPNSKFWDEFLPVIRNGGTFYTERGSTTRRQFYAPYIFTSFPIDLDAYEYQAILGSAVNLREKPDAASLVIASLSYNVVKIDYDNSIKRPGTDAEYEWFKVETLGGKKGFVRSEYVRGTFDYRAAFNKKQGKWKMTAFIAGD